MENISISEGKKCRKSALSMNIFIETIVKFVNQKRNENNKIFIKQSYKNIIIIRKVH